MTTATLPPAPITLTSPAAPAAPTAQHAQNGAAAPTTGASSSAPGTPPAADGLLYRRVADLLAASIRSHALARGDKLPSVRDLARQQGVSPATAVQAYRALEDARLIEARPRSGYFVAARPPRLPEPEASKPPAAARSVDLGALALDAMRLAVSAPDHLSFGAACPAAELFAQDRVRRAVTRAAQRHPESLCRYPLGPGHETLRRAVARHAALRLGCRLDADHILVTHGCIEAITLCLRAVTKPGDVVALESPTYFGFLQVLHSLSLRALEIPTHPRTGMSMDALQLAFDTQPVKAVLTVPTLSNPLGACMPIPERRRLAQMASARGVAVIEDVINNDLVDSDDARRAVKSFDAAGADGHVMVCGSFSKTMAPGIRLGWVEAGRWRDDVRRLKAATSGSHTELLELAMAELLTRPGGEAALRHFRAAVAARVDEARGVIARSFPKGTRVTDPPGGFFLWLELPAGTDATALFHACLAERIVVGPGPLFGTGGRFGHCLRLGVGGRWDDAQRAALRRVGEIACRLADGAAAG